MRAQPWFEDRKVAQVAAFFARAQGGNINVLKLVKLIYIADRRNMEKYEFPITGDNFVSMEHGPVNSITLNLLNGTGSESEAWEELLTDRAGHNVGLRHPVTDDQLDELSEAEIETLHEVWTNFGHMDRYEIRDWAHENCPEWEDPNGSSNPIPFERVYKFLNKPNAEVLEKRLRAVRNLKAALSA